ncbi:hypothetical protein K470DRAFT_258789 [Piedraia hortae CBS 480.64]|uniref:Oxysterol-binding protein n=1 Tax=Piedraia hortae CBS 480.64 TaxID=1314780 RepID=A0A6A7BX12_9PEZI|nr:hypothetical protein K470DRAFT_258789 [Piedraia hortae CBS 480.64]
MSEAVAPDGKMPDDSSRLRTFISILRRFAGVSDIAAVRFSLPAQLLEPMPNLEYWHYLDRPERFAAIGDSDDAVGRMVACLQFWFTKDIKYVSGRPCKPYNSTLGEFFRCFWDAEGARVSYLTEQTSHHPPVSAYWAECPQKAVTACGYDQLSAKFTGTSVKVTPGQFNQGIFITLHNRDEVYRLTHPIAYLGGIFRGNLSVSVADTCFITCAKTGLKVILHYQEEGYFGKTQNRVEGVVFNCDVAEDKTTRIKSVPEKDIVGRIDGSWTEQIFFSPGPREFKKVPRNEKTLLADVRDLRPVPKQCPPPDVQLPNESRRFWAPVSDAIAAKQFSSATDKKQILEEKQREKAAERKAQNRIWTPRFFVVEPERDGGMPRLTDEGVKVIRGLNTGDFHLELPDEYGAL